MRLTNSENCDSMGVPSKGGYGSTTHESCKMSTRGAVTVNKVLTSVGNPSLFQKTRKYWCFA
jgi:hypothetical protein